ncbi:hypothetical protein LVD15_02545 [Fulvivirga maritima]|uniref:hypothetical protein n=1 Tax=Fulvivirga maritima TaxID=2904247 RepID=UPI001F364752|nr:hypothetical protein [Fulvivirga maritima]UII27326.1 hypothetical protein LVD15_02545 [Fulvivirga maritima]
MMKQIFNTLSIILVVLVLASCDALTGKEVARIPVNEVSTDDNNLIIKETSIDLEKGDELSIWSDIDVEYEGDVVMSFRMEVLKDGAKFGGMEIDPFESDMTMSETKVQAGGLTKWQFNARNANLTIEEDGNYTFQAILVTSENPTLKISKAEIVLKK